LFLLNPGSFSSSASKQSVYIPDFFLQQLVTFLTNAGVTLVTRVSFIVPGTEIIYIQEFFFERIFEKHETIYGIFAFGYEKVLVQCQMVPFFYFVVIIKHLPTSSGLRGVHNVSVY
jgi:hypothetical protein